MVNAREYLRAFRRQRNITDLIPFDTFANSHTCWTKTNSAVTGFSIDPIDDECQSDEMRQRSAFILRAAFNLLGPNHRYYQYLFRTRDYRVPEPEQGDVISLARYEHQRGVKGSGSIEIYHALETLAPVTSKVLSRLRRKDRREYSRQLIVETDSVSEGLSADLRSQLRPIRMNKHMLFGLFHRLLNLGEAWHEAPHLVYDNSVDQQLRRASVFWDNESQTLRVGRRFVRVYTLQILPEETIPNVFGSLLDIDIDFALATTWQARDRLLNNDELRRLRNLVINIERSTFGVQRAIRRDPTLAQDLRDAGIRDDLSDLNELLGLLRKGRHNGRFSYTVLLHADSPDELIKPAAEIGRVFRLPMAQLHEEHGGRVFGNVLPVYFSLFPGNKFLSCRNLNLRSDHYADLSLVWAPDTGAEPSVPTTNVVQGRSGMFFREALRVNGVAARVVFGKTRSGKSLYAQEEIAALQAYKPITRIYDIGHTYELEAAYYGGSVVCCSIGEWSTPIAPFHGSTTTRNFREFAFQFCAALIESDDYKMTAADNVQLYEKLRALFTLSPSLRRLKVLRNALQGGMKDALTKWVEGGQYGDLFDHTEDQLTGSDFQVYEFQGVEDGSAHPYLQPLLLLLIYRDIRMAMTRENRKRLKIFAFDECAAHINRPQLAAFLKRILKTFQKLNCLLMMLTQTPDDLGALRAFVMESCSTFAFFYSPGMVKSLKENFDWDEHRIGVFQSLLPREFLYHEEGEKDLWKKLKLTVDPLRYWLYTTRPDEVDLREKTIAQQGDLVKGLQTLATTAMIGG